MTRVSSGVVYVDVVILVVGSLVRVIRDKSMNSSHSAGDARHCVTPTHR